MDLRLRNLEQLDVQAVPVPHGTEVVTRVDRIVGERRVPQGSVGRVTKVDGDDVDVTVVGVGVLRYARSDLSPRRVGQVLFAHRRANAWEALLPCVVLDTTVGSRALHALTRHVLARREPHAHRSPRGALPGAEPPELPPKADEALVIFPAEQAREFQTPQADDYWTPSTEDVRAAANAITNHLNKHAASTHLDSSDEWFGTP